ncbi:hypothetical protein LMTR3_22485 [Bradyrhizobium sp. LMTR 3]|nr:hypothetical protein LMTR3_22485 [Bradyrhizobium sp. LMTR 3]
MILMSTDAPLERGRSMSFEMRSIEISRILAIMPSVFRLWDACGPHLEQTEPRQIMFPGLKVH